MRNLFYSRENNVPDSNEELCMLARIWAASEEDPKSAKNNSLSRNLSSVICPTSCVYGIHISFIGGNKVTNLGGDDGSPDLPCPLSRESFSCL